MSTKDVLFQEVLKLSHIMQSGHEPSMYLVCYAANLLSLVKRHGR